MVYALSCANSKTLTECQVWQLEPGQQRIGRVLVAEPHDLRFSEPPRDLPAPIRLGLVTQCWTRGEDNDEAKSLAEDRDYLDEDARRAIGRQRFVDHDSDGSRLRWLVERPNGVQ